MNAKRQCALYRIVEKIEKAEARKRKPEEKMRDKLYEICRKYNKALDELTKDEITKTEHKFLIEFITKIFKCPVSFYPNLQ